MTRKWRLYKEGEPTEEVYEKDIKPYIVASGYEFKEEKENTNAIRQYK